MRLVGLFVAVVLVSSAAASAQSLSDLARKEKDRQAKARAQGSKARDIEENRTRHREMLSKTGGAGGVPVIDVEGIILQGYSAESLSAAISAVRGR